MSEHPRRDVDDRLADWVDGRLSEKERERFVAELRVNAQLRQDLERYERTVGVLRAALRAPAPPAGIADRVMAAIASPASLPARRSNLRRMAWGLAAAAALLAAAVWIDAWRPALPSGRDSAAVDDVRDAAVASKAPAVEEQVAVSKPDAEAGAAQPPEVGKLRAAGESAQGEATRSGGFVIGPETTTAVPAREQADGKVQEAPSSRAAVPQEDRRFGAGPGGAAPAPSAPTPSGPATGGPGARGQPPPAAPDAAPVQGEARKEAGDDKATWRDGVPRDSERADAPLPMVVVEGVAVAPPAGDAKAEQAKAQKARSRELPTGGGDAGKAKGGEATGRDDFYVGNDAALQARIDAFLADAATTGTPPAAVGWNTARGELRLSPMVETTPEPAARPVAGTGGAQLPIVRAWLVEGTRADLEILLARLAHFTEQHKLTRRNEETRPPAEKTPAEKTLSDEIAGKNEAQSLQLRQTAAPKPEVSRMVLRFRLRSR